MVGDSNEEMSSTMRSNSRRNESGPSLKALIVPWTIMAVVTAYAASIVSFSSLTSLPSPISSSSGSEAPLLTKPSSQSSSSANPLKWNPFLPTDTAEEPASDDDANSDEENAHPPLFPLQTSDYIGFSLAVVGLMVASGGGIGGGGILVPIYILVMGFPAKNAIPLSNITVFGGAIANTALTITKRHPLADRPLINWDLILVMEPLTIAGALIGAYVNDIIPTLLLVFLLVVVLGMTSWTTLKKAVKLFKKETIAIREREERKAREASDTEAKYTLLENSEDGQTVLTDDVDDKDAQGSENDDTLTSLTQGNATDFVSDELAAMLEEEKSIPLFNVCVIVTMFFVILFVNVMKGGGSFKSPIGIVYGSLYYWLANVFMLVWIVATMLMARVYLIRKYKKQERIGYNFLEGDIKWDSRATIVYPLICTFAGVFAGLFGVGGGIVKGPLMLTMNVHPVVASGTLACMIFFTSFTATTSFFIFGLLVEDYAIVCLINGFISTFVGKLLLNHVMKKNDRNSLIAFSIGGVVLLSAILMSFQTLYMWLKEEA